MPFTSTYSTILATQTDADSPLDTNLMDAIRQNIDYVFEYIGGKTYTPSTSHTHDGVNSALLSVNEASIDWANAGGISQTLVNGEELFYNKTTVASTAYVTLETALVHIPANANTLEYAIQKRAVGIQNITYTRLAIGASTGTDIASTSQTYNWSTGSINISALSSGWNAFNIQAKTQSDGDNATSMYVKKIMIAIR